MHSGLVITIEGLGNGLIGAYGASHAFTPAIDHLAASGLLLDQCFADALDPLDNLKSLWTGRHALQPEVASDRSLWSVLRDTGRLACLITDSPEAAQLAQHFGCPQVTLVKPVVHQSPCGDNAECAVMGVFAEAVDQLASVSSGLVWLHSRGLRNAWDAPLELRQRFIDPEDPAPPADIEPPSFAVDGQTDPDLVVGWGQVAAAQACVIDEAIGVLRAAVEGRPDYASWSMYLILLGGVPLGAHGFVGWRPPGLTSEEISCGVIIRPERRLPIGSRRSELCQLPDVAAAIIENCDLQESFEVNQLGSGFWGRSPVGLGSLFHPTAFEKHFKLAMLGQQTPEGCEHWIRTPAWCATLRPDGRDRLYVKPDDRWEVSDIASRRADILQMMREAAASFEQALAVGDREALPHIDDLLCSLMR